MHNNNRIPIIEFKNINKSTTLISFLDNLKHKLHLNLKEEKYITAIIQSDSEIVATKSIFLRSSSYDLISKLMAVLRDKNNHYLRFNGRKIRFKLLHNTFINVAQVSNSDENHVIQLNRFRYTLPRILRRLFQCQTHSHIEDVVCISQSKNSIFVTLPSKNELQTLMCCNNLKYLDCKLADSFIFLDEVQTASVFSRLGPPIARTTL